MNLSYEPQYFVKWLFNQKEAWLSADGRWSVIQRGALNTMPTQHLLNTLLMLERTAEDIYSSRFNAKTSPESASTWLISTPLYKAMKEEVLARI